MEYLGGLLEEYRALDDGEVATDIPELSRRIPNAALEWCEDRVLLQA